MSSRHTASRVVLPAKRKLAAMMNVHEAIMPGASSNTSLIHADRVLVDVELKGHDKGPSVLSKQDLRRLWLLLRTDGDWWTLDMLKANWESTCMIQHAMNTLEKHGFVESRNQSTEVLYSITTNCRVWPESVSECVFRIGCELEQPIRDEK